MADSVVTTGASLPQDSSVVSKAGPAGALFSDRRVQDFRAERDRFLRQVNAAGTEALRCIEGAISELDFIQASVCRDTMVLSVKVLEFIAEAAPLWKIRPRDVQARILERFGGSPLSAELSESDIALGEKLHELGEIILGHRFHSLNPRIILGHELQEFVQSVPNGFVDPQEWERQRKAHQERFSKFIEKAEDDPAAHVKVDVSEDRKRNVALRVRLTRRCRGVDTHSWKHGAKGGPKEKKSGNGSSPGQRTKLLRKLWADIGDRLADTVKAAALGKLGLCLDELCCRCQELTQRQVLKLSDDRWHKLVQLRDQARAGREGNAAQFESAWTGFIGSFDQTESLLFDVADALEECLVTPAYPGASDKIREIAQARCAELGALGRPRLEFRTRENHLVSPQLARAIFGFSFAQEQGDENAAALHFAAAAAFQRREVRAALQVLYHERGLIHDSAYKALSENCGQHREAPPPPPGESEEERAARVRAEQERQERLELSAIGLSDYVFNETRCRELAESVPPESIDTVVLRLETAVGKEITRKLLCSNPGIFLAAATDAELFGNYAYTLVRNAEIILRRYEAGADPARYADPRTLAAVLKQDADREQRAVRRQTFERTLQARGFDADGVFAILSAGFDDQHGGHNTTASSHVPASTIFGRLCAALPDYCEREGLLQKEFGRLCAEGVVHGSGTFALNLLGGKKGPKDGFWREVLRFAMSEPART